MSLSWPSAMPGCASTCPVVLGEREEELVGLGVFFFALYFSCLGFSLP